MGKKEQKMVPVKVYRPKEKIDVSSFYAVPINNYGDLQKATRKANEYAWNKILEQGVEPEIVMIPEKPGSEMYSKMRIKKGKMNQSGKNYELA